MKKFKSICAVILVGIMIFGMYGCGEKKNTDSTGDVNNDVKQQEVTKTAFEQFEDGLNQAGLTYEKVTMGADLVGAVEGYKYKLDNGKAEIYRFEDGSEALKTASENKSIYLEGFGSFPAEINGNLAMVVDDDINKDALIELFNSIK